MTDELKALLKKVGEVPYFSDIDFSDVNATNALGMNALHCVVIWNDLDAAKLLISSGIDVNKHGEHGYTPLHEAAAQGHEEMVKLLLDSGANPFARTEGDLPFTTARLSAEKNSEAICNLLDAYMRKSPYRPKGWIFKGEDLTKRESE